MVIVAIRKKTRLAGIFLNAGGSAMCEGSDKPLEVVLLAVSHGLELLLGDLDFHLVTAHVGNN